MTNEIYNQLKAQVQSALDSEGFPPDTPTWSVGDDVPLTWYPNELKYLHKKTLRDNYKRGVISYITYLKMLRS